MSEKRTKKTTDERKAEMEALHAQLAEQVDALRTSEAWARYLTFCAAFHRYSLGNLLLILAQREDATQVAGYRAWHKLGRQVRKGERGIRIIGTGERTVTDEDKETGDASTMRRRVFFPVSVFDIGQTDATEGAEDVRPSVHRLDGEDEAGIFVAVAAYLRAQGWTVSRESILGERNGFTTNDGHRVVVDAGLSPAQAAKTALHEAGHVVLGHLDDDFTEYLAHRGRYEVEAESVAYVLAALLGLDTSAYSVGYVAEWAERAQADVIKDTAARVLQAVHTLATALAPEQLPAEETAA
jgi:antirestriction protein ArdC